MCCWGRRIYEDTHGRVSEQEPWRPQRRKRREFIESLQSCAPNLFLCLEPWKYQMQRYQRRKNWKTRENTVMAADVSQEQKWGDRWNKDQGPYCSFCVVNGSLSSQEFRVGTTIPHIQRSSCTPRRHCEGWFRILRSIYWTWIISFANDGCKSDGRIKATWMRRTSSGCSICLYPGQNGRCTVFIEDPKVRMSRYFGNVHQNTNGVKSWSSMEDPVVLLERNLYGHLLAGLLWER